MILLMNFKIGFKNNLRDFMARAIPPSNDIPFTITDSNHITENKTEIKNIKEGMDKQMATIKWIIGVTIAVVSAIIGIVIKLLIK